MLAPEWVRAATPVDATLTSPPCAHRSSPSLLLVILAGQDSSSQTARTIKIIMPRRPVEAPTSWRGSSVRQEPKMSEGELLFAPREQLSLTRRVLHVRRLRRVIAC